MNNDSRRRRLIYRASHRGIKEMDLLLGGYAKARAEHLDSHDLDLLEELMDVPDQQLYAWITSAEALPDGFQNAQFDELKAYCFKQRTDRSPGE